MPRFMVFVPANEQSEAGELPPDEVFDAMGRYNEELSKAGVLLDFGGLAPTSAGARVRFADGQASVVDGPFTESKELVAGYWLLEAKTREEAVEWVKRAPFKQFTAAGGEVEIQVRPLYDVAEFGDTPALERTKELEKKLGIRS